MKPYKPTDLDPLIPVFAPPEVTAEEWEAIRASLAPLADPDEQPRAIPLPASCVDSDALQRLAWHLLRCARAACLPLHFVVRAESKATMRDGKGNVTVEVVPAAIVAGVRRG